VTTRETLRVYGDDALGYLQGQLSQDVQAMADGETKWSLVLQPTGKLVAWFRVQRRSSTDFLLDIDPGFAPMLTARLQRFLLRTKATIEPTADVIDEPVRWPGLDDPDDEAQRIRAGMPRMGAELTEETIPGEGGQRFIDLSVSFTKGCYTGQELVARIDSRGGNVPRPIRVLEATAPATLTIGAAVLFDGEEVGSVTSVAGNVALAPLARKVTLGSSVVVDGVPATVIEPA